MKSTVLATVAANGYKMFVMELEQVGRKWVNGYILLPEDHILHGKHYNQLQFLEVHGGLTYSKDNLLGVEDKGWFLGFDTLHAFDTFETQNKTYVANELFKLLEQLESDITEFKIVEGVLEANLYNDEEKEYVLNYIKENTK